MTITPIIVFNVKYFDEDGVLKLKRFNTKRQAIVFLLGKKRYKLCEIKAVETPFKLILSY